MMVTTFDPRRQRLAAVCLAVLGASLSPALLEAQSAGDRGGDWPQWRGPTRDAAVSSFMAPASWPAQLTRRWTVTVGLGYATPLLVGNRLYQFSRQGDEEVMSALDAATGASLWRVAYPAPFAMNNSAARHGAGPKSTPAFAEGRLFSIGMTGVVTGYDAATGRQLWQKPGSSVVPTFTTHAFSPIVEGNTVIFHVGGNNQGALTAFDVATGAVRWSWNGDGPSYGSPVIATISGTRQLITLTQTKLVGVDPRTGALLWERPFTSSSVTNAATPIVVGDTVLVSNGGPMVATSIAKGAGGWTASPAWENADVPYRLSNALQMGEMVMGFSTRNSGQYFAVDPASGMTLWMSDGRQGGNAALVRAGDFLVSLEDDGDLIVARPSRMALEIIQRYKVGESETWTAPVLSGRRFFIKDVSTLSLWTMD